VPQLVRVLVINHCFGWSLRQLEFQVRYYLLLKWFAGYPLFAIGPDYSTLDPFEQWVIAPQHRTLFDEVLRQIIATEGATGNVALVFREFPLTEIHPNALSHAHAAECAAAITGNDAFWKFADELFANQPVDPANYGTLASEAGISSDPSRQGGQSEADAFATCYATASTTLDARINADRTNALDIGANGTPYSVILVNGQPQVVIPSAYSYDAMKQLVDQALAY